MGRLQQRAYEYPVPPASAQLCRLDVGQTKAMAMVQLELDDKDKESFQEMQQSVGQAQQELQMVSAKLRTREQEGKLAALTLSELQSMDDTTIAYQQECSPTFASKAANTPI